MRGYGRNVKRENVYVIITKKIDVYTRKNSIKTAFLLYFDKILCIFLIKKEETYFLPFPDWRNIRMQLCNMTNENDFVFVSFRK